MTTSIREIEQGVQEVGLRERITFSLTTTRWGSSPSNVSAKCEKYDPETQTYIDITTSVFPAGDLSIVVTGDDIKLPILVPQTIGDLYLVSVIFTCSGMTFDAIAFIKVTK